MGAADGRAPVVGAVVSAAAGALAEERDRAAGEQLAFMALPIGNPRAKHLRADVERRNRAGRPPGSVNRSTKELREWLLRRGQHPLQHMFQWMQHTPQSLAAELGCTQLEAFDRLRDLWRDAAPYFAPKLIPTDDQGREIPAFAMFMGGQPMHAAGGAAPWDYLKTLPGQVIENAPVSPDTDPVSQTPVSHTEPK